MQSEIINNNFHIVVYILMIVIEIEIVLGEF